MNQVGNKAAKKEADLNRLRGDFPLGTKWTEFEVFEDLVDVAGVDVNVCGLIATHEDGTSVSASAGDLEATPYTRAWFELVERTSIVEFERQAGDAVVTMKDASGRMRCRMTRAEIMPASPEPAIWTFAKSNGVAAHSAWGLACRNAASELQERDAVLRSWWGCGKPSPVRLPGGCVPEVWGAVYETAAFLFPASTSKNDGSIVAGVFSFPRPGCAPFVFGFGARDDEEGAIRAAARECIQRLGFLWGEDLPTEVPPFAPTPDYHQEFFLGPQGREAVAGWLRGDHLRFAREKVPGVSQTGETLFCDLTPSHLEGKIAVVKAWNPGVIPLTFGRRESELTRRFPPALLVHPIM